MINMQQLYFFVAILERWSQIFHPPASEYIMENPWVHASVVDHCVGKPMDFHSYVSCIYFAGGLKSRI